MKLRTKLIPLFTAASAAAVIAPVTLTSCGDWVRYTDLLHKQYESWVRPFDAATASLEGIEQLYAAQAIDNRNIIRDDILWSFSTVLHNTKTKKLIDDQIKYTEFNLDVSFPIRTVFYQGVWEDIYCADFEVHVAGEIQEGLASKLKDLMIDEDSNRIKTFDLYFSTTIYGLRWLSYDITEDFEELNELFANRIGLNFNGDPYNAIVKTVTSGSYTFLQGSETVTKELNNAIEFVQPEGTKVGLHYGWFGVTVLALLTHAITPQTSNQTQISAKNVNTDPIFYFGSHYLQNVKYVPQPTQK